MQKRKLGNSDLLVAPIAFGGNVFGWTADEKTSFDILSKFTESDFNFIDTDEFDILESINTLRIEPYLTSSQQRSILDILVKSSKLYANFNNSYGGTV